MKRAFLLTTLAAFAAASVAHAAIPSKPPITTDPQGLAAMGLVDMAFNQHKVAEAFAKYVGPTYSQSGGPDARQKTIDFLAAAIQRSPDFRYDFQRILVDRDVVAVYAIVYVSKTDPGNKVVDFYRFENGKIVEHSDVIQPLTPASGFAPRPAAAAPPAAN